MLPSGRTRTYDVYAPSSRDELNIDFNDLPRFESRKVAAKILQTELRGPKWSFSRYIRVVGVLRFCEQRSSKARRMNVKVELQ